MKGNLPETMPIQWSEWLTSPTIRHMSLREQGAFVRLLIIQWQHGVVDDRMLPRALGLSDEEISELMAGVLGMEFPVSGDGQRLNYRLGEQRARALGKSIQAQRAASSRWASDSVKEQVRLEREKGASKPKRVDGREELDKAVAQYDATHGEPIPSTLRAQMELYRQSRAENGQPCWKVRSWLKNLSSEFTFFEWEEAYKTATRSNWASIHPRKSPRTGQNVHKPSKFGDDSAPIDFSDGGIAPPVDNPGRIVDTFVDPNTLWNPDESK